jgi:phosphatidylglycerol---prolipoprotein diacylglyceryl transferase
MSLFLYGMALFLLINLLFGLVLGWRYLRRIVQRPGWRMTPTDVDDLLLYATIGVVLGGRLGYVLFYRPDYYLQHPLEALAVWQGGMSFHGGVLGVLVASLLFAWWRRLPPLEIGDGIACAAPIGLGLGRIANFINAELYGRVTDVPWGVIFPNAGPDPRHPSQLYQAFLEGLVLFLVLYFLARRPYVAEQRGLLTGAFLTGYALARMFAELFREPDPYLGYLLGGLTMGQLLSLPMLAAGLLLLARAYTGPGRPPRRAGERR